MSTDQVSTELRDRFFALSAGQAPADEVAQYLARVDATDADEPTTALDGLGVCAHPTARHKAVRFVDAERIDAGVREQFARPSEAAPYLAAVFVDPRELSFRTFENIVPLDRQFTGAPLELELTQSRTLAEDAYAFSLQLPDSARIRLEHLDEMHLYVPPLNAGSRGGERFIFHSALLADALTKAVSQALPQPVRDGFSHVNPVFRCNRFEPGDTNFHRHRDTPYYDAQRQHVSRYTVLIYLTGGSAEPALDLTNGAALTDIDAFTCVIFDQRYEHEGAPYRDGRKVFLRTELIFTDPEVTHDPEIGALFSRACYLTGESVFTPELARHADTYYNQVAAAHWSGLAPGADREPFVHKQFRGVHFVANGYDFWFAKSDALSLAECAAITLLDYFNCKLGDTAFRALADTEVVEAEDAGWIPDFLREKGSASTVVPVDKSLFFPAPETLDDSCCPFHRSESFEPTRNADIVEFYFQAQTIAKAHIMPAPIVMLGEDVLLDPEKFLVEGNLIHVLGKKSLTPVNFAACWNSGGWTDNYVDVEARVEVAHFLVPPIMFTESDGCYHLQFDFFRNSWMVRHQQTTIPVPMILSLDDCDMDLIEGGEGETPWLDAVPRSLIADDSDDQTQPELWWVEDQLSKDEAEALHELNDIILDHDEESEWDDEDDEDDEG